MKSRNKIDRAIDNGYSVNVPNLVGQAWDVFKDGASYFIVLVILSILLSFFTGFLPIVGEYVYSIFIGPILGLGYAIIAYKIRQREPFEFETAFDGFRKYGSLILAVVIRTLLFIIILFPLLGELSFDIFNGQGIANLQDLEIFSPLLMGLAFIILYLFLALRWMEMLIYFYDYTTLDALKTSFALVNKNIGVHLLLLLFVFIITLLGLMAFVVGLLAAFPICIILDYLIFEKVTGLLDEEEDEGFIFNSNEDYL